jgi:hypothetical protein
MFKNYYYYYSFLINKQKNIQYGKRIANTELLLRNFISIFFFEHGTIVFDGGVLQFASISSIHWIKILKIVENLYPHKKF